MSNSDRHSAGVLVWFRAALKASACAYWRLAAPARSGHQLAFVDLWQPGVDAALARLHVRAEGTSGAVARQLSASLLTQLCHIGADAAWTLFNVERGMGQSICACYGVHQQRAGPTPRMLYRRFIARHRGDGLASMLAAYPVLGRHLAQAIAF